MKTIKQARKDAGLSKTLPLRLSVQNLKVGPLTSPLIAKRRYYDLRGIVHQLRGTANGYENQATAIIRILSKTAYTPRVIEIAEQLDRLGFAHDIPQREADPKARAAGLRCRNEILHRALKLRRELYAVTQ